MKPDRSLCAVHGRSRLSLWWDEQRPVSMPTGADSSWRREIPSKQWNVSVVWFTRPLNYATCALAWAAQRISKEMKWKNKRTETNDVTSNVLPNRVFKCLDPMLAACVLKLTGSRKLPGDERTPGGATAGWQTRTHRFQKIKIKKGPGGLSSAHPLSILSSVAALYRGVPRRHRMLNVTPAHQMSPTENTNMHAHTFWSNVHENYCNNLYK